MSGLRKKSSIGKSGGSAAKAVPKGKTSNNTVRININLMSKSSLHKNFATDFNMLYTANKKEKYSLMNVYPVNISTQDDMKNICAKIGTDPRALAYLIPKRKILHFYADNIDYRAASFLKQELLSRGGDTVVTKHVIDGKTDYSDILLMATPSQLRSLIVKLKSMDCWGLKEFREKLSEAFTNCGVTEWEMTSPAGHKIILGSDTKLMSIMNITPDSFYSPSRINEAEIAGRAEQFLRDGAYILDLGAESTRPGAEPVPEDEESARLIPALKTLRREFPDAIISVDTCKTGVARIAAGEGADIINDVSGFTFGDGAEMPGVIAGLNIPYVLSHIKGTPADMAQHEPYTDILTELSEYFRAKLQALDAAGVKRENVIIDPGIGFGKGADDNFAVLRDIESLHVFGRPILVGHSRKRFTGTESIAGTLAVSALLCGRVSLLRVHEVTENMRALDTARAMKAGI